MEPSQDHLSEAWRRWNHDDKARFNFVIDLDDDDLEKSDEVDDDSGDDPEESFEDYFGRALLVKDTNFDKMHKISETSNRKANTVEGLTERLKEFTEVKKEHDKRTQDFYVQKKLPGSDTDNRKKVELELERKGKDIKAELSKLEPKILKALHDNPTTVDMIKTLLPAFNRRPRTMHKITTNIGWFYSCRAINDSDVEVMLTHLFLQKTGDKHALPAREEYDEYASQAQKHGGEKDPCYFDMAKEKIEHFTREKVMNKLSKVRKHNESRAAAKERQLLEHDREKEEEEEEVTKRLQEYDEHVRELLTGYCDCIPFIDACTCAMAPELNVSAPSRLPSLLPTPESSLFDTPLKPVVRLPKAKPTTQPLRAGKPKRNTQFDNKVGTNSAVEKDHFWAKTKILPKGKGLFAKRKHGSIIANLPKP